MFHVEHLPSNRIRAQPTAQPRRDSPVPTSAHPRPHQQQSSLQGRHHLDANARRSPRRSQAARPMTRATHLAKTQPARRPTQKAQVQRPVGPEARYPPPRAVRESLVRALPTAPSSARGTTPCAHAVRRARPRPANTQQRSAPGIPPPTQHRSSAAPPNSRVYWRASPPGAPRRSARPAPVGPWRRSSSSPVQIEATVRRVARVFPRATQQPNPWPRPQAPAIFGEEIDPCSCPRKRSRNSTERRLSRALPDESPRPPASNPP